MFRTVAKWFGRILLFALALVGVESLRARAQKAGAERVRAMTMEGVPFEISAATGYGNVSVRAYRYEGHAIDCRIEVTERGATTTLLDGMRTEDAVPARLTITPPDGRRRTGGELLVVQRLHDGAVSWEVILHERTPDGGFTARRETKPLAIPPGATYSFGLFPTPDRIYGPQSVDDFSVMAQREQVLSARIVVLPAR